MHIVCIRGVARIFQGVRTLLYIFFSFNFVFTILVHTIFSTFSSMHVHICIKVYGIDTWHPEVWLWNKLDDTSHTMHCMFYKWVQTNVKFLKKQRIFAICGTEFVGGKAPQWQGDHIYAIVSKFYFILFFSESFTKKYFNKVLPTFL